MSGKIFKRVPAWGVILGLWVIFYCLGVVGWAEYEGMLNQSHDIPLDLYLTAQLIVLNSGAVAQPIPLALNIARFALPLLTLLTAIQAFLGIFKEQVRAIRLSRLSGHVLICGLSRKGMLLANRFRMQGTQVVVIEQDEENPWIESCREQGMFTLVGDASEPTLLLSAGIQRARGLFAVCDEDGINAGIAVQAKNLLTQDAPPLQRQAGRHPGQARKAGENVPFRILMHNASPQLVGLLHHYGLHEPNSKVRIIPFNVFERAAAQLLDQYPAWTQAQIEASQEAHILLVGLGRMGENIILHAARKYSTCQPSAATRLHFTIIDRRAPEKVESLRVRHPGLEEQCVLIPLQMEVNSAEFEGGAFLYDSPGRLEIEHIYVCLDNDALGLHAGLMLRLRIPEGVNIPIVIRMSEEAGLARLLEDHRRGRQDEYSSLSAFGYLDHTCTPELLK